MSKKLQKNGFVEGAFIAYAAIVVTKLMGALYNIPFYSIIGEKGGVIYSYAYSIYTLFLQISTSGIPIAISIIISEYNSLGKFHSKEKAYSLGLQIVTAVSAAAFVILQMFAPQIGRYFLRDMTDGVSVDEIALAVRSISICLLIVPFLSMKRGYLQGHKFLTPPSHSQVIEQFVRIVFVLVGSYSAIRIFRTDVAVGVCVGLLGAAVGALVAYLYLWKKFRSNRELFNCGTCLEEKAESTGKILKKIFSRCATIVLISISTSVYDLVDLKMLLHGLHTLSYSDEAAQLISSIASTWIPKICMIISALSIGLTSSIAPFISESYAKGDLKAVNEKLNQAIGTTFAVSIPLGAGMIMLASPLYCLFYGRSIYGGNILQVAVLVNIFGSLTTVICMAMQSINRGKTACLYTVIGMIVNASLDLPLIYLFDALGLPAYLGASAASVIGQIITMVLLLGAMRKAIHFSWKPTLLVLVKTLPIGLLMSAVVYLLIRLWPISEERNMMLFLQLILCAVVGGAVYLPLSYKTGVFHDILGEDMLERILSKFCLKRGKK